MAFVFVSTFPPFECGIATYTKYLTGEFVKSGRKVVVLSEGGENLRDGLLEVKNTYSRHGDFASEIFEAVSRMPETPEMIHFQHAPDLIPDKKLFLSLLKSLHDRNIPIAVTLHTVYDNRKDLDFYVETAKYAHIIVHNEVCREILKDLENVSVIFHGTSLISFEKERELLRKEAGFSENDIIFLSAGFIHFQKNLHTVAKAFRAIHAENSSLKLIVAGRPGGNKWYNKLYLKICMMLAGNSSVKLDIAFMETKKLKEYLHISDIVLLPYWQKYASASGIFHLALGAGRPFICSESTKFAEARQLFSEFPLFVPMTSVTKWKRSMKQIAEDKDMRAKISKLVEDYAKETSWENACKKHLELYKRLIKGE